MNGILLLDKEQTWTSNDAVVKLKGILHQRRVGHAGTLDPMATGMLVVFAGRATRAVSFAEAAPRQEATLWRAFSTATRASCPKPYRLEGLPYFSVSHGSMASRAVRLTLVVAALSA